VIHLLFVNPCLQSEIASILCTQEEAGQVAGTMIKELIERVKQNSVSRRQIFKHVEWILPWINTLVSVSGGLLEQMFSLIKEHHNNQPIEIQKIWCTLARKVCTYQSQSCRHP
jgi:hypothetical protein